MPIRPEFRHLYRGSRWNKLRAQVLRRAEHHCEGCGVGNKQTYFRTVNGELRTATVYLTIAHLNHNPHDNRLSNLKALCQRCHLAHDKAFHAYNRRKTWERKKGLLSLFPLEFAPKSTEKSNGDVQ
jgi:5-methylcytosine-specific restriction endonuclease McrA